MLIDSAIIKLERVGLGVNPDYSITIYGYGNVVYDGKENVKKLGEFKEKFSTDKFSVLLEKFKEIDFFSLDDTYPVDNAENRPYTTISISITEENNKVIKKNITHYHGDKKVPRKLIDLEDKIDEIAESDKWVKGKGEKIKSLDRSDIKGEKHIEDILEKHKHKKKPYNKKEKKLNKKIIMIIISLVIIVVLIFYIMNQFINNSTSNNSIIGDGSKKPIIMSAEEYITDKNETRIGNNFTSGFNSLNNGDILIIEDTIDDIIYRAEYNDTIIRFYINMTEDYNGLQSIYFKFYDDLTDFFNIGDKVRITVTILHVNYSIDEYNIDEEIFKEEWPGEEAIVSTGSYLPLPQSCIEKVQT